MSLGPSGGVRVVVHDHRNPDCGGDSFAQGVVTQRQVRGGSDDLTVAVDQSGDTHSHRGRIVSFEQLASRASDRGDELGAVRRRGRQFDPVEHVPDCVDDAGGHLGSADVDTDRQRHVSSGVVCSGVTWSGGIVLSRKSRRARPI